MQAFASRFYSVLGFNVRCICCFSVLWGGPGGGCFLDDTVSAASGLINYKILRLCMRIVNFRRFGNGALLGQIQLVAGIRCEMLIQALKTEIKNMHGLRISTSSPTY